MVCSRDVHMQTPHLTRNCHMQLCLFQRHVRIASEPLMSATHHQRYERGGLGQMPRWDGDAARDDTR
jgi:hypothetical protein